MPATPTNRRPPLSSGQGSTVQQASGSNLDSKDAILARRKFHDDESRKEKIHDLRLIAANYLDLTGASDTPVSKDGKFGDVDARDWEMGRHNSIMVATQIQAKGLTFNAPELSYEGIPADDPYTVALVRKQWFLEEYERQQMQHSFMWMALDGMISGEGGMCAGVRDNECFLEWSDALNTTWDPMYRETHRKRFVFKDVPMPLGDAIAQYPALEKEFHKPSAGKLEETVIVTIYYSKTTKAVLYKKVFIAGPEENPYGRIPNSRMMVFHQPGVKHPTGSVEAQIGTESLKARLQRAMREIALRSGSPVGVARGEIAEGSLDDIQEGIEAAIVRFHGDGNFEWAKGADITPGMIQMHQMLEQQGNAESGVNAFQQNRTDVKVDFATQLQYMAAQSGVQSKFVAQQLELAIKDSIDLFMDIGARYATSKPMRVGDALIPFGPDMPVNPLLGSDGKLMLKANATEFKSAAQKLQEAVLFGNAVTMSTGMPPGTQELFVKLAAEAFEVENPDQWSDAMLRAQEQQMAMQAQQQQMSAQQPPSQGSATGQSRAAS